MPAVYWLALLPHTDELELKNPKLDSESKKLHHVILATALSN